MRSQLGNFGRCRQLGNFGAPEKKTIPNSKKVDPQENKRILKNEDEKYISSPMESVPGLTVSVTANQ